MQIIRLVLAVIAIGFAVSASGQSRIEERTTIVLRQVSVLEAIEQIEDELNLDFAYDPGIFTTQKTINATLTNYSISEILKFVFAELPIAFQILDEQILLTTKPVIRKFVLSGYVVDQVTKERLGYSTIYFPALNEGVTCNEHGYFNIVLQEGDYDVQIGYVGRDELQKKVQLQNDKKLVFSLENNRTLDEVVVTPKVIQGNTGIHKTYYNSEIQQMTLESPSVGGESDVLQMIRGLPGIQSNAGGVGALFVRGGDDDQNLVLMDGVPIYYPSHLLGIYSIFNAESVRNIQVYKGGFPARYGGRLSSVIDVHTKDGRIDGWHADVSGSYQSIRGAIQGPISRDINVMIGGRTSISSPFINDVVGESFYRLSGRDLSTKYDDLNVKLTAVLSDKEKLVANLYSGRDLVNVELEDDELDVEIASNLSWNNTALSLNYRRELGRQSYLSAAIIGNNFFNEYEELVEYEESVEVDSIGEYAYAGTFSDNKDLEFKFSIDHFINSEVTNRYGASFTAHKFEAASNNIVEVDFGQVDSSDLNLDFFPLNSSFFTSQSYSAFVEHERRFSPKLFANFGLRWSGFANDGTFSSNLEPRLNISYLPSSSWSMNFSLSKMVQYIHQISNSSLSFPRDIWVPAGEALPPSSSWQIGIGASKSFPNRSHIDIQAYFKQLIDLNFIFNITESNIEGFTLGNLGFIGDGRSYGIEVLSEIPLNRFVITNALSISKTTRAIAEVNDDVPFPFDFDRRMEWKSNVNFRVNDRFSVGTRFYFGSALPEYLVKEQLNSEFAFLNLAQSTPSNLRNLNDIRAKNHYRMDLSVTYNQTVGKTRHSLKANLYNLLDIANSGFSFQEDGIKSDVFSIPFLPSLQYNISF